MISPVTRQAFIPSGNPNRPGTGLRGGKAARMTWHETANTDRGANAEMHRQFVWGGGGVNRVSFHFVVDDREIIQLLPLDEVAWHAGRKEGNETSLSAEMCVHSDGDRERMLENAVRLGRWIVSELGIALPSHLPHRAWYGKDCPHILLSNGGAGWADFMKRLGAVSQPNNRYFPETGFYVSHGFLAEYQRLEARGEVMRLLGYPIGPEAQETIGTWTGTVQYFQRGRMEWHTESGQGLVLYGLVGSELLAARAEKAERVEGVD